MAPPKPEVPSPPAGGTFVRFSGEPGGSRASAVRSLFGDLMGRHVVLQSLRDSQASNAGTNVNMYVHKIVELPGGFAVTPHQPEYPHTPLLVEDALLLWYNAHFAGADPLGIAGMGNRAGQATDGIEAIQAVEAVETSEAIETIESDRQSGGESEENGQGHGE